MWQTTKDGRQVFIVDYPDVIRPEQNPKKVENSYIMGLMRELTEQWREGGGSTIIDDKQY